MLAQSKGALQAGYVDAFQPRYAYGATLSPELLAQLEEEAAWAKAAQGLRGAADRAALLRYLDPAPLTAADPETLEQLIRPTGFFRAKAKSLIGLAAALRDR
ncbi:hypothetical protein ACFXA3_26015, partial [Streptomyces sp. NPDC059456]